MTSDSTTHSGSARTTATHAYAARYPGKPGYGAVCVDDPKHAKDTAQFVSDCILDGAQIERVTLDAASAGLREYFAMNGASDPTGQDEQGGPSLSRTTGDSA